MQICLCRRRSLITCLRYLVASSGKLSSVLGYTPLNITAHTGTMNLLWFNSKHQREPPNSSSSYFFVSSRYFCIKFTFSLSMYLWNAHVNFRGMPTLSDRWMLTQVAAVCELIRTTDKNLWGGCRKLYWCFSRNYPINNMTFCVVNCTDS